MNQVSGDLKLICEKLEIVEKDFENVKAVKKYIEFINEVKERLKAYTNKFELITSKGNSLITEKRIVLVTILALLNCAVLPKLIN